MIEALLTFVVITGTLSFIVNPLLAKSQENDRVTDDTQLRNLEQEKFNIYAQIKEADFEYEMGKLSYRDYRYQRQELMQKAAEIIDEIDAYINHSNHDSIPTSHQTASKAACPECASPVKDGAKFCAICGFRLSGDYRYCTECGSENPAGSKFCHACGEGLVTA